MIRRMAIAQEGTYLPDGRYVVPGALCMHDREYSYVYTTSGEVVGIARNLQRKGDVVSMVVVERTGLDLKMYEAACQCAARIVLGKFIHSAPIRSVTLIPIPAQVLHAL